MAYTNIDDPSAYFQTALYTGNGSTQSITNDGNSDLQPDWVWIKQRSGTRGHSVYDSSRGVQKRLATDSTAVEATSTVQLSAFNADGFEIGSGNACNENAQTYAAWQWKCNGGTTVSNTDGSTTTTVQVNQDAGFSIVTYTGTGAGGTMGHGLGVTPDIVLCKNLGPIARAWSFNGNIGPLIYGTNRLTLNQATALTADTDEVTAANSTTFTGGGSNGVNVNGYDFVAYCFASKQGFSKFGSYISNGNADGPFVYTGFKPAFVIIKSSSAKPWVMKTAAISENPIDEILYPNLTNAEGSDGLIDFVSNGFKVREGPDANINNSLSSEYIYMAFAENPFTTSTGIPTTAR